MLAVFFFCCCCRCCSVALAVTCDAASIETMCEGLRALVSTGADAGIATGPGSAFVAVGCPPPLRAALGAAATAAAAATGASAGADAGTGADTGPAAGLAPPKPRRLFRAMPLELLAMIVDEMSLKTRKQQQY